MQANAFRLLCCAMLYCSAFVASAERVAVVGTDASFEPPAGFKELSAGVIALKFNRGGNPPKFVLGNEDATTTVAYEIRPIPATEADLPEMLATFDQQFQKRVPGLKWIRREIIELSGQRWIFLEFTSTAADADIHNLMLMTPVNGALLAINFNSTRADFIRYETELRASIYSIRLHAAAAEP